ncbi:MAG: YggS family pyridoxal phosphate-dependent enzyme [Bacteroidia bacterium]
MTAIAENIIHIKKELQAYNATLVAVSKTKPAEMLREAYQSGQKIFGENYVQEMADKQKTLPADIKWHFIGHLQSNKVKYIAPFVSLIHGVDSFKLLKEINKEAAKISRVIDCLLQLFIAEEETKFGFTVDEIREAILSDDFKNLNNICIKGLMAMATNTDDKEQIRKEFKSVKLFFDELKTQQETENFKPGIISTGMSNDYKIALEEGSNMVRIGSLIFGERE